MFQPALLPGRPGPISRHVYRGSDLPAYRGGPESVGVARSWPARRTASHSRPDHRRDALGSVAEPPASLLGGENLGLARPAGKAGAASVGTWRRRARPGFHRQLHRFGADGRGEETGPVNRLAAVSFMLLSSCRGA